MDEAGLRQMTDPSLSHRRGRRHSNAPEGNTEFAAKYIPHAKLDVLPGQVSHEIFDDQCDQVGRDDSPDACMDAPGVDRAKVHGSIGNTALKFFDAKLNVEGRKSN